MLNSVVFVIVATLINVVIMIVILLAGFILIGRLAESGAVPGSLIQVMSIFLFVIAILGAFLGYNRILRWFASKVDMEKYFHPLIKPKDPRR